MVDNTLHFEALSAVDEIKEKLTDAEYKDIVEALMKLRDGNKLRYNKSVLVDMMQCCLSSITFPNSTGGYATMRPLEAINFISSFANIITNLKTMTEEPEDTLEGADGQNVSDKRAFIFQQLSTSYTGDFHKTTLQLLNFKCCKEMLEHIDELAI